MRRFSMGLADRCSPVLISRKALNSLMTDCAFLILRLLRLCTQHVRPSRPSTPSAPLVTCVAGVWKETERGFRARGFAPNFPSPSLSNACHAGYAMASLPRRRSFGSSSNPPQRREGTHDEALISDQPFYAWSEYYLQPNTVGRHCT